MKEVEGKMFHDRDQSYAAQLFADYRSENNHLITKFKNVQTYLNRLKKLGDVEKKDIVGGILSFDSNLGTVFDSIDINLSRIIEIVEELVKCLENEKKDLDKFMSKLKNATTESEKRLENLLVSYNNEQYDYMQQLNTLVPGLIELADRAIGMEDLTFEETAKKIEGAYKVLEGALLNEEIDKDSLYIILEDVLFKLRDSAKYLGDVPKHFKNSNAKKFVSNFRRIRSLMKDFEKHRKNCGRDKDETKDNNFTELKDDKSKEKLHKFMKEKLTALFYDIKINDEDASDRIEKIIAISDFKATKEAFEKKYDALRDKILSSKYAKTYAAVDGGMEALVINLDGLDDSITIGDFKSGYLEDEKKKIAKVKEVTKIFKTAIDNSKAFEALMKLQKTKAVFIKDEGDDDDDGEKLSSDIKKSISNTLLSLKPDGFDTFDKVQNTFDPSKIPSKIKNLLTSLFGLSDGKYAIKESDGKYKCSQFVKIIKHLKIEDKDAEIQKLLKYVKENSDSIMTDLNSFMEFIKLLSDIVKYNDLKNL